MPDPNAKHNARLAAYAATATALSLLSDRRLGELLAAARRVGSGIGGSTSELDVEGVQVFVKKVPLTELEQRGEHVMSTANLFGLPTFYQYPLGSAGFGAWRELGATSSATFLREWIDGSASASTHSRGLSPPAAAMLSRCAPPALLTLDFHRALSTGSKTNAVPGCGHRAFARGPGR